MNVTAFTNRSGFHAKEVMAKDLVSQMPLEKEDCQLKSISLHLSLWTKNSGGHLESKRRIWAAMTALSMISGQKVSLHYSKKSVPEWRLTKGSWVGVSCELRRRNMYQFLENFRNYILPSLNGWEGIPLKAMDSHGNLSWTLQNIISFPEIEEEYLHFTLREKGDGGPQTAANSPSSRHNKPLSLNITFHTSAKTPSQSLLIYSALQLPSAK